MACVCSRSLLLFCSNPRARAILLLPERGILKNSKFISGRGGRSGNLCSGIGQMRLNDLPDFLGPTIFRVNGIGFYMSDLVYSYVIVVNIFM